MSQISKSNDSQKNITINLALLSMWLTQIVSRRKVVKLETHTKKPTKIIAVNAKETKSFAQKKRQNKQKKNLRKTGRAFNTQILSSESIE